jgi:hypothetical protein
MTPAQFYSISSAWRDKEKREDYRFGVLTAIIRQIVGGKDAQPMDYFGGRPKPAPKTAEQRRKELEAYIAAKKEANKKT